ncbi:MAG TPA: hypothetical protein EYG28_04360 [Nitrospiria bacterium]|nr:hypothetical protein [Candidatus Manganitrophaceae bacterium]HIL34622.1 hypothetical protein [Candidatus Manganitrophaceae bacterium]
MKICLFRPRTVFLFLVLLSIFLASGCKSKDTPPVSTNPGSTPTDSTPPTVLPVAPLDGATNVDINSSIIATFSEAMIEGLLTKDTFIVFEENIPTPLTGDLVYNPLTKTATFSLPNGVTLTQGKLHTITITTGVEDLAMNKMVSNKTWSFRVGILPDETPPGFTAGITSATATSTSTISLSWAAATDDVTPPSQLRYVICQSENPPDLIGECTLTTFPSTGGTVTLFETTGGQTSFGVTGLKKETTYDFVVRAKDLSNNVDENFNLKSAKTFGDPVITNNSGTLNINLNANALNPSITLVGTKPYLTWQEVEAISSDNIFVSTFDGTSWIGQATSINAAGKIGKQPRVVSDGEGTPTAYLSFTECELDGKNCKVIVQKETIGWEAVGDPLNVNLAQSASDSAIAFDGSNTPYVVWTESTTVPTVPGPGFEEISHIFVKHFNTTLLPPAWDQGGTTHFNVDANSDGLNPAIAINGTKISVSWKECRLLGNCELYLKQWEVGSSPPASATTLNFGTIISEPDDPSLVYNNGVLYVSWHENGGLHVRREETSGSFTSSGIENMGFVIDGSNNTLFFNDGTGQTATIIPATYKTGSLLAGALKSALESANPATTDIYTVSFVPATVGSPAKFTIMNDASNATSLTLFFGNVLTTAGEFLGFNPVNSSPIPAGSFVESDFDPTAVILPRANTPVAGTGFGPYLAFVKLPNTTADNPELFVRLWDNTESTWRSVVDGKLNMTTASLLFKINASLAVSSTGSVFVAWVEAGSCLAPPAPQCGLISSDKLQLYVKQLK